MTYPLHMPGSVSRPTGLLFALDTITFLFFLPGFTICFPFLYLFIFICARLFPGEANIS